MDIGLKEIKYIGNVSRIMLSDEEKKVFKKQLSNILDYIKKLSELNTDEVKPMAYATELKNVFREDKLKPSFSRQKILDLSTSSVNGFVKVPKILE